MPIPGTIGYTNEAQGVQLFNPLNKNLNVGPPVTIVLATGVAQDIYLRSQNQKIDKFTIQNVGTGTCKYLLNDICTTNMFHGIVAASVAAEDGLGSVVNFDFTNMMPVRISVLSDAGTTVIGVPYYNANYPIPPQPPVGS